MNYTKPNPELVKALLERGFNLTAGCCLTKVVGLYTLKVWVHSNGGQAEVQSRVSTVPFSRVARLPEFDTIKEIDQFFAKYDVSIPWGRLAQCTCVIDMNG